MLDGLDESARHGQVVMEELLPSMVDNIQTAHQVMIDHLDMNLTPLPPQPSSALGSRPGQHIS